MQLMNINDNLFPNPEEKPLDNLVAGYSNTAIFRKIAFVGDSLSSGEFETVDREGKKGYHDLYEYSFGQYIARANGLCAYNFSRGGMTAEEYMTSFAESRGFFDESLAAQAYVIALGVNDILNQNRPIGKPSDVNINRYEENAPTFTGYYAKIISKYKEISPDAKFFLVVPPRCHIAQRNERAEMIREALISLSEIFDNTYVIDLYKYAPVYDEKFERHYYLHTHMNPMGYIFAARMLDSYIDYIIRHNPEDFYHVGFIGSGIQYKF